MDRNYYADHSLTLARHPSETEERLIIESLDQIYDYADMLRATARRYADA